MTGDNFVYGSMDFKTGIIGPGSANGPDAVGAGGDCPSFFPRVPRRWSRPCNKMTCTTSNALSYGRGRRDDTWLVYTTCKTQDTRRLKRATQPPSQEDNRHLRPRTF